MFKLPESFSKATTASLDAQIAAFSFLTSKTMESVEKLIELNMTVAKTALEETNTAAKQLAAAKDPQEFFSLTAEHAKPSAEKAMSYARHLAAITSGAHAEFTKAAEEQAAETNRKVSAFVEEISKNAPAGSENAISMLKSALGNASAGYEQINKSTKQVVETLEANLNTAVHNLAQAAEPKTASRAKKA